MTLWKSVFCLAGLSLVFASNLLARPVKGAEEVPNWTIPGFEVLAAAQAMDPSNGVEAEDLRSAQEKAVLTTPSSFVGITPCRIADTRGLGFGGAYGPPSLSSGVPRDFILPGRCDIPANAQAVSLNLTIVLPGGSGYLAVFPKGGVVPVVSTINFSAGQVIANAAIVPLGTDGAITAFTAGAGGDLLIDTNGYFVGPPTEQKLCTVHNKGDDGDAWRETLPVPASWTPTLCELHRQQIMPSGSYYQLGCLRDTGITLGTAGGGLPSPNCGW
jgi:hypothetical protein